MTKAELIIPGEEPEPKNTVGKRRQKRAEFTLDMCSKRVERALKEIARDDTYGDVDEHATLMGSILYNTESLEAVEQVSLIMTEFEQFVGVLQVIVELLSTRDRNVEAEIAVTKMMANAIDKERY